MFSDPLRLCQLTRSQQDSINRTWQHHSSAESCSHYNSRQAIRCSSGITRYFSSQTLLFFETPEDHCSHHSSPEITSVFLFSYRIPLRVHELFNFQTIKEIGRFQRSYCIRVSSGPLHGLWANPPTPYCVCRRKDNASVSCMICGESSLCSPSLMGESLPLVIQLFLASSTKEEIIRLLSWCPGRPRTDEVSRGRLFLKQCLRNSIPAFSSSDIL